ncbi:DNA primase [Psychrosphaera sp. B3R10]|uniref:DNA primase n=1 Tax=unclassified Psychrosphaera TaxID=2641570 RepID=UPI001C0932D8|nr:MULTISPECIES: DNA primase [unclassified Psychrosphaera]MBU2880758.1 DNA primase [Psychrosphaera sp. I2R16]MBU2991496.1 DNA primase [Psychrosphaera sp. B3R10]MDO6719388.1 DNA primase [Psychrosphaera sp. 1_MG-2023]
MTGRIPKGFIDDVVARTDIIDLIDAKVPLKKAGKNYQACCPFHNEKSPSFSVSPEKQFYHCFGCGAHGNAISFLMEYEQLEFVEAIEELARLHSIDVPREDNGTGKQKKYPTVSREQKQSDYELMELAAKFFQHNLKHDQNSKAVIDYLKNRNLSGEICQRYGIGYAPDSWDSILKSIGKTKAQQQQLLDLKVLNQNDSGRTYDFFRKRVMFPIRDKRGRVVGFGGRVIDDGTPKYLNSPETRIFHKGNELYGFYQAKQANQNLERVLIVEGYMDVVSLAQQGISYAVAALGTATTPEHMQLLFRSTRQVICCYDGDRAGRDAAWRALENAMPHLKDGVDLRFTFLPDGEDPDTMVQKEGKEAFEVRLGEAKPLLDYFFEHFVNALDITSDAGKSALLSQAKPLIEVVPSDYYKEALLAKLARLIGRDADKIKLANRSPIAEVKRQQTEFQITPMRRAIGLLLQHPNLAKEVPFIPALANAEMPGFATFIAIQKLILDEPEIKQSVLLERFRSQKEYSFLARLFSWEHQIDDENLIQEFAETFKSLQDSYLEKRLEALLIKGKTGQLDKQEQIEYVALMSALKS